MSREAVASNRRSALQSAMPLAVLFLTATICLTPAAQADGSEGESQHRVLNFVVIPDAHTLTGNLRFVPQIVDRINALELQPDFVMSLGDNVSGGKEHQVLQDANAYHREIARLKAPHYYVIGNHECIPVEVYKLLTWEQLLSAWEMDSRWYSFDIRGFHIIVLDGWISLSSSHFADDFERQQEWFLQDLQATTRPTVVFIHQAIGFQQEDCQHWIDTDNRKFWPPGNFFETTIEAHADKIAGVFEGHKHKALWKTRNGIAYHQMGASHAHNGQFAQVFIDPVTRKSFVQAHPEVGRQDSIQTIQQTYGDRSVLEKLHGQSAAQPAP